MFLKAGDFLYDSLSQLLKRRNICFKRKKERKKESKVDEFYPIRSDWRFSRFGNDNFYHCKSQAKLSCQCRKDYIDVTGELGSNGTSSVPKSVPRLVVDKVRLGASPKGHKNFPFCLPSALRPPTPKGRQNFPSVKRIILPAYLQVGGRIGAKSGEVFYFFLWVEGGGRRAEGRGRNRTKRDLKTSF